MSSRIVVDTNVFIASILSSSGSNREVIRRCLLRKVVPLMGAALFHEYEDLPSRQNLMENSCLNEKERETLFTAFLSVTEWVKIYYLWRPNLPDEADNHLVELALAGGAQTIITNNIKDLTRGELPFPGLKVETPNQFLSHLS